jgi:3-hydroxyisobutyrate dehydrogenase
MSAETTHPATAPSAAVKTVGFIGLGNVGAKLAGSVLRNGFDLVVRDLDPSAAQPLLDQGARWAESSREVAEICDLTITCLPSPEICAEVMEGEDGVLSGLAPGKIWLEMSTTHTEEVICLGKKVLDLGAEVLDSPVSGGCHRAATGNISIFAGGARATFDRALPVLSVLGRRILHTGDLGSASTIKVVTNYLASAHLVALSEGLATAKQAGMDMRTVYEAILASSGNSFVHETESQVILNGSYNINFTMDLVSKDTGLFLDLAKAGNVPVEMAPLVRDVFRDGRERYGDRAWSSQIVKRLEDDCGCEIRADGFPAELIDEEPEERGWEVRVDVPVKAPGEG